MNDRAFEPEHADKDAPPDRSHRRPAHGRGRQPRRDDILTNGRAFEPEHADKDAPPEYARLLPARKKRAASCHGTPLDLAQTHPQLASQPLSLNGRLSGGCLTRRIPTAISSTAFTSMPTTASPVMPASRRVRKKIICRRTSRSARSATSKAARIRT